MARDGGSDKVGMLEDMLIDLAARLKLHLLAGMIE